MEFAKVSIFALLFFTLFGCTQNSSQSESKDAKNNEAALSSKSIEETMIDTIFKLTEVKIRAAQIEEQTNGKTHLKIWIVDDSTSGKQEYTWVKVGEDNGISLVTHFNFHVYPPTMRIMYFDTQNNIELSLTEWRKRNSSKP